MISKTDQKKLLSKLCDWSTLPTVDSKVEYVGLGVTIETRKLREEVEARRPIKQGERELRTVAKNTPSKANGSKKSGWHRYRKPVVKKKVDIDWDF